jgi:hypothetical protein
MVASPVVVRLFSVAEVAGGGARVSFRGRRRTKSPGILPGESTAAGTAGAVVGGRCRCIRRRWWAEAEGVLMVCYSVALLISPQAKWYVHRRVLLCHFQRKIMKKAKKRKKKKKTCDVRSILLGDLTINHMPRSIFTAPSKNVYIERKKGSKA